VTGPVEPQMSWEREERERTKPDGTKERVRKSKFTLDPADIAVIGVVGLILVGIGIACFVADVRDPIFTGVIPTLAGILTLTVGGVAAYKEFIGGKKKTKTA
jgi:hypothetical protein